MSSTLTKTHFPPQVILQGKFQEALSSLAGNRVLVVGSSRSAGLADWPALFPKAEVEVFAESAPHSPQEVLDKLLTVAEVQRPDTLIAIGSSSAIDLAKAVFDSISPEFIAIPTSLGGSEMTNVYGIRTSKGTKEGNGGLQYLARKVIYDPGLLITIPGHELAASAINSWAHCIEAFYSVKPHWFGKAAAVQGGRAWPTLLQSTQKKPLDINLCEQLFEAASLAGFAINTCGLGLHHAVCHVIGGATGIRHGIINAIALPHTLAMNREIAPDAIRKLEKAFVIDDIVIFAEQLVRQLGLPDRLDAMNVSHEMVQPLSEALMHAHHLKFNPAAIQQKHADRLMEHIFSGAS
ncbi:MAG: iron-containing alcohol dehydrogenase [Candidimonas sp.]|nr:MAG: iron-containing alcohol dehydrogenase [Candidimonas sp.]TAM21634.1 MAG: iron-containing alcohol dehydrogenase [Candidimonas sp.]TAM79960.1 MAG: iron-containing alcohol dehydrogenase [Candidimonas sp.]